MSFEGLCMTCFMLRFIHTSYTAPHTNRNRDVQCCFCVFKWVWDCTLKVECNWCANSFIWNPSWPDILFLLLISLQCSALQSQARRKECMIIANIKREILNVEHLSRCWKWSRNSFLCKPFHLQQGPLLTKLHMSPCPFLNTFLSMFLWSSPWLFILWMQ